MAVHIPTTPRRNPPSYWVFVFRVLACALLLVGLGFGLLQIGSWTWEQVKDELERPPLTVERGFRVGGASGIGTTERSLFAALALQGIVAREGVGSSAAARREQVEASLRYADLLLELQLKEVRP